MVVHKVGKIPANCRVDVDYTGKEPKIKFGYTSKDPHKDARDQNYMGPIFLFLFMAWGLFIFGYLSYQQIEMDTNPQFCRVYADEYHWFNQSNLADRVDIVFGYNFTCNNGNYYVKWADSEIGIPQGFVMDTRKNIGGSDVYYIWEMSRPVRTILLSLIILIILNNILTRICVKMKWYQHWIPRWNAKGVRKSYWKFRPADVENNMVEIPKFSNVLLEYKAEGDFSKYLTNIKIREHRHYEYDYKKKKVGKLKVNAYKWYARFFFSEKPKNGYLEVIYR